MPIADQEKVNKNLEEIKALKLEIDKTLGNISKNVQIEDELLFGNIKTSEDLDKFNRAELTKLRDFITPKPTGPSIGPPEDKSVFGTLQTGTALLTGQEDPGLSSEEQIKARVEGEEVSEKESLRREREGREPAPTDNIPENLLNMALPDVETRRNVSAFVNGFAESITPEDPTTGPQGTLDFSEKALDKLGEVSGELFTLFAPGVKAVKVLGIGKAIATKSLKKGLQKAITKEAPLKLAKRSALKGELVEDALVGAFVGGARSIAKGETAEEILQHSTTDALLLPAIGIPMKRVLKVAGKAWAAHISQKRKNEMSAVSEGLDEINRFIGMGDTKEAAVKEFEGKMKSFERMYIDKLAPLRWLQTKVFKDTGFTIPIEERPFEAARLFSSHYRKIENHIDKVLTPIFKPVRNLTNPLRQKLALESINERLLKGQSIGNWTPEKTDKALQEIKTVLGSDYEKVSVAAGQVRGYLNDLLKYAGEGGLLKEESINTILAANQRYIPFNILQKISDRSFNALSGGKNISVSNIPIKVAKGFKDPTLQIEDPLGAVLGRTHQIITAVEKNKVMKKFITLGELDPSIKEMMQPITTAGRKRLNKQAEGIVSFFDDGVKKDFKVPKILEETIKGMNEPTLDFVAKWARSSSKILRMGATTLSPVFQVRNTIRDFSTQAFVSDYPIGPIGWMKGFYHAVKGETIGDKLFDQMIKENALMGGIGLLERQQRFLGTSFKRKGDALVVNEKAIKQLTESQIKRFGTTVTNPVKMMELISSSIELAPRVGIFQKTLTATGNPVAAAWEARNSTIDFTKMGVKMQVLNAFIPFFNARTQGSLNLIKGFKKHPIRAGVLTGAAIGVPTTLVHYWNTRNYPELDKQISQKEKENNWVIIIGTTEDEGRTVPRYLKIPKPEVGKVFGNIFQMGLDFLDSKDPQAVTDVAMHFLDNILPFEVLNFKGEPSFSAAGASILPPALKAGIIATTRVDPRTGLNVEGRFAMPGLSNTPPELRYNDKTGVVAKALGKVLKVSPIIIQKMAQEIAGPVGGFIVAPDKAEEAITQAFIGKRDNALGILAFEKLEDIKGIVQGGRREKEIQAELIADTARTFSYENGLQFIKTVVGEDEQLTKFVNKALKTGQPLIARALQRASRKNGERAKLIIDVINDAYSKENKEEIGAFLQSLEQLVDENTGKPLVDLEIKQQMQFMLSQPTKKELKSLKKKKK